MEKVGVAYFEVTCVHEGSRGDAGQATAVYMHVRIAASTVLTAHPRTAG